jgi:FKBP-type peptidyl-prolyl cis-trans isomerase FkpA
MKLKLSLVAAFVAILSLTACGGGSDSAPAVVVASPATLTMPDTLVGTGAVAAKGNSVTVNYTGWLYTDAAGATDHKGTKFESNSYTFTLGTGTVIAGWDQGIPGMKVGGKRMLSIPASLAYGSRANGPIPANSGLVFDVELVAVK